MQTALLLLAVALIGLAGLWILPPSGANILLTGVVAWLILEMRSLRNRLSRLEERPAPPVASAGQAEAPPLKLDLEPELFGPPVRPAPPAGPAPLPAAASQSPPDKKGAAAPAEPPPRLPPLFEPLIRFFTGSNPVLKIGIIILFFGVAFLLKYAAQRNLVPIELRLVGVALGGLALLGLGWRLRRRQPSYGLGLEGAGVGILYLTTFAAARLYPFLPMELALALMIGLAGLSCALALLQDSRGLAASASIGGFLAPVLLSSGGGSHVQLFSFYALLNCAICTIAWFKAWRELNLIGFVFTFGIAALWGASAYQPAHFITTEPFLLLFFLMYSLIAVLFALRQPLKLRGFIDGPLVFGLPIVTAGLQSYLVRDFPSGMALSALGFGFFYLGLARLLWNRMAHEMRLLTEAFLSLGVVFASLAIPLGLDPQWTTAAWALEGAAMVWVGVRQQRLLARLFGLLLQLGAAVVFFASTALPPDSPLFGNRFFLGCALIAAAALFSSYWLQSHRHQGRSWECYLPQLLLAWGLIWWYNSGYRDLDRVFDWRLLPPIFLLYSCCTTMALAVAARRWRWPLLASGLLVLLPVMWLTLATQSLGWESGPLLSGYGWLAWPLAFALNAVVLACFEESLPSWLIPSWHCLSLWLLMLALTVEATARLDRIGHLAQAWSLACWGAVPLLVLIGLEFKGGRLAWPVARFSRLYHGIATDVPLIVLALWFLGSLAVSGEPAPLPYIPLCNPLELAELAFLLLLGRRSFREDTLLRLWGMWKTAPIAGLSFFWLNAVIGRTVHAYGAIAYRPGPLFASMVFQAAVAALWSVLALGLTMYGAKMEQRPFWLAGAGLLTLVVIKLMLIDLSGTGTIGRIVSFLVVGLLMLLIGYVAPLPPKSKEQT